MFSINAPCMSLADKEAMVANNDKMDNMIESMSRYLSDVLQIRDNEVDEKVPFVERCRQELEYLVPLPLKALTKLMQDYEFVVNSEDLSCRMRECALQHYEENVDVSVFVDEEPYYMSDQAIQLEPRYTRIDVGGLGHRLMVEVRDRARAWLNDVDKVLCFASGIECTDGVTKGDELCGLKMQIAEAIGERTAIMSLESVIDDALSARSLERLLTQIYEGCRSRVRTVHSNQPACSFSLSQLHTFYAFLAYARAITLRAARFASCRVLSGNVPFCKRACNERAEDANVVSMLQDMATSPLSDKVRRILEGDLSALHKLVDSPPCELAWCTEALDLKRLSRAFAPDLDIEVRIAMITFWSDNCGKRCADSIRQSHQAIIEWQPLQTSDFSHSVLARGGAGKASQDLAIPPPSFVCIPRTFARRSAVAKRTGLGEAGDRSECLVRFVWEMASKGYFTAGVISSDAVLPVATDSIVMNRMAAGLLIKARDTSKMGVKLCSFVARMYDMEGDHVAALDKAVCHLSNFSCLELETALDTRGDLLVHVCESLTKRTQAKMVYYGPAGKEQTSNSRQKYYRSYKSFASDSIALVLPILYVRRNRLGIPTLMRSNGLLDMLRTIPVVKGWNPADGTLKITASDFKKAHPSSRQVLDALHDKSYMIKRRGGDGGKRKLIYTVDTMALWNLVTEHSALVPIE